MNSKAIKYSENWNVPTEKTLIVTGGNSGVGFELLRHVLRRKWKVILAVRNMQRGLAAKEKLLAEFPDASIEVWYLDLSSLDSINSFCEHIVTQQIVFDVFYANAGVYCIPYQVAEYGMEMTAWVNFVANYVLYTKLKDYVFSLSRPVKWILTSSVVARFNTFVEDDFAASKNYKKYAAYQKSKCAVNMLFMKMQDECTGTNLLPLNVHPGTTHTPLIEKAYPNKGFARAAQIFMRRIFHSPEKASLSTLYVLREEVQSPVFCGPRGLFHMSGYPKIYHLYQGNLKRYKEIFAYLDKILQNADIHV